MADINGSNQAVLRPKIMQNLGSIKPDYPKI